MFSGRVSYAWVSIVRVEVRCDHFRMCGSVCYNAVSYCFV